MNPTGDRSDNSLLPGTTIDRTIGWMVGGLLVLMVFAIAIAGLSEVQSVTRVKPPAPEMAPQQPTAEIGGAIAN